MTVTSVAQRRTGSCTAVSTHLTSEPASATPFAKQREGIHAPFRFRYYRDIISTEIGIEMTNVLTAAEIKRRGMAAIEEGLQHGPVQIFKRNKPAAVVLSQADYQRLIGGQRPATGGMTALQWLLAHSPAAPRSKADIDTGLESERAW